MSVSRVSKKQFELGEGPYWDPRIQRLYFMVLDPSGVCRLDPTTGETDFVHLEGYTSFVIPYKSDPSSLLITSKQLIKKLNFDTGHSELLTQVRCEDPLICLNDGKCDAKGRLWSGTILDTLELGTLHGKGHLYKMDNSYKLTQVDEGISLSNGLAWNSNNDTMYFIDSDCRVIYAYDYDLTEGFASNRRVLIDYNKDEGYEDLGWPDGMTIDTDNKIWVCNYGGGCVIRLDPETKSILRKIDIPTKQVTSCCFGGPNLDILYVTTAARTEEIRRNFPDAGAIFAITDHGCRGLPPHAFNA